MFRTFVTRAKRAAAATSHTAVAAVDWLGRRLRPVWAAHRDKVATNAAYASATAAVLAGLLGLLSPRDVIAAVLAAALGVYLRGSRDAGGAMEQRHLGPWDY